MGLLTLGKIIAVEAYKCLEYVILQILAYLVLSSLCFEFLVVFNFGDFINQLGFS